MPELGPSPLVTGQELPVADARAAIHAAVAAFIRATRAVDGQETVPLAAAAGRVLARDLVSPIDVPAHDNSAMDGYALHGADLQAVAATVLHVLPGTVFAGTPHSASVARGQALRIMTGAVMPPGLDTVVPIELCRVDGAVLTLQPGGLSAGDNRRHRGEDLAQGQPALLAGRWLRPADVGLAASLGIAALGVRRPLRVALFSTGDELRDPGQVLPPGCIYDSNRASLRAALQRLNVQVLDFGLVRDDPAALRQTLQHAAANADAVLTSGGVSMGDADHVRDVLAAFGTVAFWKVAMRPGRPFAFGPLHMADGRPGPLLFALPGNPVAALVTFYALVRDALLLLAGALPMPLPVLQARSVAAIRKRPGRTEFQRAVVEPANDGSGFQVRLTGSQGAGILRSMSEANALVVLRQEQGAVAAGEAVDVWLFDGLV
ncbi:MAG: molybdopterin molybdotransferase MoeA [Rubrivivax sp.]|nr:molybdopterin molybdotransferase MoeA [Rubrivivax sp.]